MLSEKVLLLLGRGLQKGYSFMVKVDDDQHLDIDAVERVLENRKPKSKEDPKTEVQLYAGNYLWDKEAYKIQEGADGSFVKYFGGPCYMLSRDLAEHIADIDLSHSMAYNTYGSTSEDVNMGHWVAWDDARRKRDNKPLVEYATIKLSKNLPNVPSHGDY